MTCAQLAEHGLDLLYGELDSSTQAALEAHVQSCAACSAELEALRHTLLTTRSALRGPLDEAPPSRVRARIQQAAREEAQRAASQAGSPLARAWQWLMRPLWLPVLAGAAVLGLLITNKLAPHPEWVKPQPVADAARDVPAKPTSPAAAPRPDDENSDARTAMPQPPTERADKRQAPAEEAPAAKRRAAPAPTRAAPRPVAARDGESAAANATPQAAYPDDTLGSMQRGFAVPPPASEPERAGPRASSKARATRDDEPAIEAEPVAVPERDGEQQGAGSVAALGAASEAATARRKSSALKAEAPLTDSAASQLEAHRAAAPPAASSAGAARRSESPVATTSPTLARRIERADLAYRQGRWTQAAAAYRALLHDYPAHRSVATWKERLKRSMDGSNQP